MTRISLSFLTICMLAACNGEIGSGGGGAAGGVGSAGSGGSGGNGGTAGSGATPGRGGEAGDGGTAGNGGTAGSGGAAGNGGTAGSGGAAGNGGTAGSGGVGGAPAVVGLDVVPVITGLNRPWDIGWLPNGTVLVTERPGRLNVYDQGVAESPFVIAPTDLVASGEGGMLGLEVDPDFASNGYVYVCMCSNLSGSNDVRVVRYALATPNGDSVVARSDIVTGMPYSSGRHSGCRPRFGPDDYLWVGTGDAAIGSTPQDDASLGGKVLRIDRDGAAAPGNADGRVWFSKGHRNIQGMAFRASDELGVSAEHGPLIDDEVNLLVAGNFGWDPVPEYTESVPMTDLVKYPDAVEAIWSSGSSTLAVSGATFIEGSEWADWDGVLAVATLKASHLHIFFVGASGEVTGELERIDDEGRLRSPRQGPDGLLYVTTDGGGSSGEVLRVTPVLSP